MKLKINSDIIDKIFSYVIILLPFLYQYKGIVPQFSFGETLLIPFIFIYGIPLLIDKNIKINKYLSVFYFVSILTSLMCISQDYFDIVAMSTVVARLFFYAMIIYFSRKHFSFKLVQKFYCNIVFIFSLYLVIQYIYHYTLGGYLPIYLNYDILFPPEARAKNLVDHYKFFYRASSLFLEPSYYTLYSLPSICILFNRKKNKIDWIKLMTIFLAFLLSSAISGILGILVIIVVFFLRKIRQFNWKSVLSCLMIFVFAIGSFIIYTNKFESSSLLSSRMNSGGSFNQRITRGIITYDSFTIPHKFIGVGLNNLEAYMLKNNISTKYDEGQLNYCCSIVQTLNYSGIIGLFSLLLFIKSLLNKSKDDISNSLTWIMIIIMFYESILFTYRFAFYLILIESIQKYEKKENLYYIGRS